MDVRERRFGSIIRVKAPAGKVGTCSMCGEVFTEGYKEEQTSVLMCQSCGQCVKEERQTKGKLGRENHYPNQAR